MSHELDFSYGRKIHRDLQKELFGSPNGLTNPILWYMRDHKRSSLTWTNRDLCEHLNSIGYTQFAISIDEANPFL